MSKIKARIKALTAFNILVIVIVLAAISVSVAYAYTYYENLYIDGGTLTIRGIASSHINLYESDAADTSDKWMMEMNSSNFALWFRDDSASTWDMAFQAQDNNDVQLYYDGAKKLETASGGVEVTGTLDISSGLDVQGSVEDSGGTFTIDDTANITGDLTVDGTIYGEVAENLVLEPPAGFSVAIAEGRPLEANYLKALTGDEVTVDDDLTVVGVLDVPTITFDWGEDGIRCEEGTCYWSVGNDLNSRAGHFYDVRAHWGIREASTVDFEYKISDFGSPEFAWFEADYADFGEIDWNDITPTATLMRLDAANLTLGPLVDLVSLGDIFIQSVGASDEFQWVVDGNLELGLDATGLTVTDDLDIGGSITSNTTVDGYLDVSGDLVAGSDFLIGANFVMDDTGITDESGVFQIQTETDDLVLRAPSGDYTAIQEGLNTVGRFGGSGTYELEIYNDLYTHGIIYENSDINAKLNITPVESVLSRFRGLRVHRYQMDHDPNVDRIGLLAQELQAIFPTLVNCENGSCAINQTDLIDVAIQAILELDAQVQALGNIAALEARVAALEAQNAQLQSELTDLEARVAALEALLVAPEPIEEPVSE